jgi:hypothetical protein
MVRPVEAVQLVLETVSEESLDLGRLARLQEREERPERLQVAPASRLPDAALHQLRDHAVHVLLADLPCRPACEGKKALKHPGAEDSYRLKDEDLGQAEPQEPAAGS